ncbi:MAG: sugar ABC transporter substrate-binding protein [Clostridiales bacterium]|jgi:ribose transport system substrate-binding protein|nr:sugar ABC transporter substrate-binding protein [Clostridiales bacterium]
MSRFLHKLTNMNKNRIITIAVISSFTVGIIILVIGMTYYKYRISEFGINDSTNHQEYKYHYVIISEEADEPFWESIYQGALEKGREQEAYIEKLGSNLSISYSIEDLMEIAIASKVDGIIIEPDGKEQINELINRADQEGIPVITVLKDAPMSKRKSFVGINRYNQGKAYGEQVLKIVDEDKNNVLVLLNSGQKDTGQNIIYSGIRETVGNRPISVDAATINTQSTFSSEEDIRRIIKDRNNSPDILVCLTAVDTLCAYQAVVDYNKVGQIDIIGYYDSELILRAIEKEIIHSTMTIDAKLVGAYCVEALTEYRNTNRVSDYFSVDISVIDQNNIQQYIQAIDSSIEQAD